MSLHVKHCNAFGALIQINNNPNYYNVEIKRFSNLAHMEKLKLDLRKWHKFWFSFTSINSRLENQEEIFWSKAKIKHQIEPTSVAMLMKETTHRYSRSIRVLDSCKSECHVCISSWAEPLITIKSVGVIVLRDSNCLCTICYKAKRHSSPLT